jgi:hypothetical protein
MTAKTRAKLGTGSVFKTEPPTPPTTSEPRATREGRDGKKALPFWVPVAAKKQLAMLAIEEETTQQELLTEALNDLFRKRGKPPIA